MTPRYRNRPKKKPPSVRSQNRLNKAKAKANRRKSVRKRKKRTAEKHGDCSICNESKALDFHHWVYSPGEMGCYVCRDCHLDIHSGERSRPSETPGNEWVDNAIQNAVNLYSEHNAWVSSRRFMRELSVPRTFSTIVDQAIKSGDEE